MTKRVLLSLAVCCFFVLSPIRAVSVGEPAGAVRDAGADGLIDCGPGSEGTVWRIGDVTARVACPDSAAGIFASASLCLSSGDQDPSCVRVYPGPCRIVRGLAGGIPFYSVESSSASGPERRSLSLVFPGGTVMPVFDELKASHGSPGSLGDKVRLEWSCEYAEAPGNVFRHETTVSKDTFVLRELQEEGSVFSWSGLRAVTARYTGGEAADSHAFTVRFVTRDGQPLELLTLNRCLFRYLEKKKKRFFSLTFGECSYDMPMESGSGTILLEAVSLPEDKTVFSTQAGKPYNAAVSQGKGLLQADRHGNLRMSRLFSEEISGNSDLPGKDEGRGRLPFLKEPGETWLWQPSYCLPQGCKEKRRKRLPAERKALFRKIHCRAGRFCAAGA